ncbi:Aste57867_1395 [Aphanomyces stellatus]|uniref:Aste57867_1395 protein n=1 Tax=Aphanomyces stellatus TaxID=120398 RepID=A0A485K6C7_9STRA|nr:hypothetical protein As57867_001394 [Aphanomyces stellatus]VFT78612.1 Aste57867_1395 [Aphanomyces stellatus]
MILEPAFANDVWWAHYIPSVHQALLIDIFNTILTTQLHGSVDILAPQSIVDKNYRSSVSTTNVYPTYVRHLVLSELVSVDYAVANLRSVSADHSIYMYMQYCWVDLNHEFEVAHTEARQQRCMNRYSTNGAVYMETVLRNQKWNAFSEVYGGDNGVFSVSVQSWLEKVPSGQQWIARTSTALQTYSIDQEAQYWKSKNLSMFQMQYGNYWQTGIIETIVLKNAFGMQNVITLKNIPWSYETWTTFNLFWMPDNDLIELQSLNLSLVRSAENSFLQPPPFDFETILGLMDANGNYYNQTQLFRTSFGVFNSVDTIYVAVPTPILDLYTAFKGLLSMSLGTDESLQNSFDKIPDLILYPSPPSWIVKSYLFYGGNPVCLNGAPKSFVQETFGFYDICDRQSPLSVTLSKYSSVFAGLAMINCSNISTTCDLLSKSELNCREHIQYALEIIDSPSLKSILPLVQPAKDSIEYLRVGIIQFASDIESANWILLQQSLLETSPWEYYGWVFLFDWVEGKREVVSFEGDVANFVLMSSADTPQLFTTSTASLSGATKLVFWLAAYTNCVLCLIALMCVICAVALRLEVHGPNLMWFNHIVGSIWIGRPLMFLRGCTAVILLSTAQVELVQSEPSLHARFVFAPRPLLQLLVVSGEATWLIYVAADLFSAVVKKATMIYAPICCIFAWSVIVFVEILEPVKPEAKINRTCTSQNMDQGVSCTVGTLKVGDLRRFCIIAGIQGVSLILTSPFAWKSRIQTGSSTKSYVRQILGVADNFLSDDINLGIDTAALVMAGFVPICWGKCHHTLDLKLWVVRQDPHMNDQGGAISATKMHAKQKSTPSVGGQSHANEFLKNLGAGLGILYSVCAIIGSISYLNVSNLDLANDMFWSNYNMTSVHVFISDWLNEQLVLGVSNLSLEMNLDIINQVQTFNEQAGSVKSAANFGAIMQYSQLNTLEATIDGLRKTDSTYIPWIFTQYCFLDFGQKWELANTAGRQQRCRFHMIANGAVYLESVLRNIDFCAFHDFVGNSFDIAISNELQQSTDGLDWLQMVSNSRKISIVDEAALWRSYNIMYFDTQWQNFKLIGLVNTYTVTNSYGTSYPFTLHNRVSSFRVSKQSTYKMYWGFANDLATLSLNSSRISGGSLIRSSSKFAFLNTTLESVMFENETLISPLAQSLLLTRNKIGPFGSTDMKVIACPHVAKDAVRMIYSSIREARYHSSNAQVEFSQISDLSSSMVPVPKLWTDINFLSLGGNPLCPEAPFSMGVYVATGLISLLSWNQECTENNLWTNIRPSREVVIAASILANTTLDLVDSICAQNEQFEQICASSLTQSMRFVNSHMVSGMASINQLAIEANIAIEAMDVQLLQFGQQNISSPLVMYALNILDRAQVEFRIFAWFFLVDWTLGYREVISLEGDIGSINLITEYISPLSQPIDPAEMPMIFSSYICSVVRYITSVMIVVAGFMLVYVFLSRGHIEVWNLFELQRVGAIVWVGRPLLFVRSLTAISLLSTCTLQLFTTGYISYFAVMPTLWYKTILAANEVTWLVAIVNDLSMVVTQEYTVYYCTINSIAVWLVTATLSVAFPTKHNMAISKQCQLVQVDLQVVCTSANLVIGDVSRLVTLIVVVVACNVFCYLITRAIVRSPHRPRVHSNMLCAGAIYLFETSSWIYNDIYYMDRVSAAVNGILTVQYDHVMYGLDIKLWCTFQIPMVYINDNDDGMSPPSFIATRAKLALPLRVRDY